MALSVYAAENALLKTAIKQRSALGQHLRKKLVEGKCGFQIFVQYPPVVDIFTNIMFESATN